MKFFILIFSFLIFIGCGKSGGNGAEGASGESAEPELTATQRAARSQTVVGAVISSINLKLDEGSGLAFQYFWPQPSFAPQIDMCEAVKAYYEHFGNGDCSNSCPEADLFSRNCSEKKQIASCAGREFIVEHNQHLMEWDMSGINDFGAGRSEFRLASDGLVSGNDFEKIPFSCAVSFEAFANGSTRRFSCGQNFNLDCNIDGVDYECRDLIENANEMRRCAGEFY